MTKSFQIAVYYFPNYHPDARNARVHGPGWSEWELVKRAEPRFSGHQQPKVPLWGYTDESDPQVMAQKIDAAADYGIDAFIFDWYWYNDGPFLQRGLEDGFLRSPNNPRLKFACMWANHDWVHIHPAKRHEIQSHSSPLLYPGTVTRAGFEAAVEHVVEQYFKHSSYWKIDGMPYFSFYDLPGLVKGFGSVRETRRALDWFRDCARSAGFPGLHLNQVLWNQGILPGEEAVRDPNDYLQELGFDSFTSYVWIHHAPMPGFPTTPYEKVFRSYLAYWERAAVEIHLPYFPNASMGWDSSPRTLPSDRWETIGYPFTPVLAGNTPAAFQAALETIRERIETTPGAARIITINSWNEWTEGSYLEPDTHTGMAYLEAIRNVFGTET